jgi:hypothetical protein
VVVAEAESLSAVSPKLEPKGMKDAISLPQEEIEISGR